MARWFGCLCWKVQKTLRRIRILPRQITLSRAMMGPASRNQPIKTTPHWKLRAQFLDLKWPPLSPFIGGSLSIWMGG